METYEMDATWRQMQDYLPAENQLTKDNLPIEYYMEIDKFQVHIDHYKCSKAKGRLILFHGVGGNGRLLSFIAVPLRRAGYDVICPDLPLYGYTQSSGKVSYIDWVSVGASIVNYFGQDDTPVFIFGLSAGGMLAYQVACKCKNIKGILATCILDQRNRKITKATAINPIMGLAGLFLANLFHKPLGWIKLPMKMVTKMTDISNNRDLAELLMGDKRSSGASVSLSFLQGMLNPKIEIEPEEFNQCPFLLIHPEDDRWTDVSLSRLFFDRLACQKKISMLPGAGHFPLEKVGLAYMEKSCLEFLTRYSQ